MAEGGRQMAEGEKKRSSNGPPSHPSSLRIGHGFDLHRLAVSPEGRRLVIAGLTIDHDRGCVAHSDGDVVYHALTDALLGALALGDIGELFPDTDPKWKDTDSAIFIREAMRRVHDAGYTVVNADVTVILQRPKLRPHVLAMRENIAQQLDVSIDRINLKGKTHEHVDSLGHNEAIACHCVVLLQANPE